MDIDRSALKHAEEPWSWLVCEGTVFGCRWLLKLLATVKASNAIRDIAKRQSATLFLSPTSKIHSPHGGIYADGIEAGLSGVWNNSLYISAGLTLPNVCNADDTWHDVIVFESSVLQLTRSDEESSVAHLVTSCIACFIAFSFPRLKPALGDTNPIIRYLLFRKANHPCSVLVVLLLLFNGRLSSVPSCSHWFSRE